MVSWPRCVRFFWLILFVLACVSAPIHQHNSIVSAADEPAEVPPAKPYAGIIAVDEPTVWWRFGSNPLIPQGLPAGREVGNLKLDVAGPRPEKYRSFDGENRAAEFDGRTSSLRYRDPGEDSLLDFQVGDSITLEAWVNPVKLGNGQQTYIIGKGRTQNPEAASDNQNYALRLTGKQGAACLSFLFRSASDDDKPSEWHRWNSNEGFTIDSGWHHVAVTYTFGQGDSVQGYLDGKAVKGTWDYAGKTDRAPIVDNDELWIGSSMGGNPGSTFQGGIDEIALYRKILSPERIQSHVDVLLPKPYVTTADLPKTGVLVELMEGIPNRYSWDFIVPAPTETFVAPSLTFVELPHRYNRHGIRIDRANPLMMRASANYELPAGEHRILVRARGGAKLSIDGQLLTEVPFPSARSDGHNHHRKPRSEISTHIRPPQPGDREMVATFVSPGGLHRFEFDVIVGGIGRRPELGETSVSIAPAGSDDFTLLNHRESVPLTDDAWLGFEARAREELALLNQERRRKASEDYARYWDRRHQLAREVVGESPEIPAPIDGQPANNNIDRIIGRALAQAETTPGPAIGDEAFLRRVTVDIVGTLPAPELIQKFLADSRSDRRERYINQLLEQPGWADNWMGYWQDVLAENPNVINPTLNNTGPFRWWIHESFSDNKPFDRFATELILMEGSANYGGTAGFAIASQNDAPFAAKAHIVAQAFLGMNLKCARCHDAPFHDFTQQDLFSLAAMLNRGPQSIPKSSTIPGELGQRGLVTVALKPGAKIDPAWPFAKVHEVEIPSEFLEDPADPRELLAARMTFPQNQRFAEVIVNRLWKRYLGVGLVDPVDDWDLATPSNAELLKYLAWEFQTHNYDLKHVARLILNSHAYQRATTSDPVRAATGVSPLRRRLTAEQVVDSLFAAAGKELHTEDLNIDVDGSRQQTVSISLGAPSRGWHFTSLSNERDRPSLSLPAAQTIINVLETFGWRASRQDPITIREQATTVLQPAILANGIAPKRVTQLSEDSAFTRLALEEVPLDTFIDRVFLRVLTRHPSDEERTVFRELLAEGYESRRLDVPAGPIPRRPARDGVSWSNHLRPESNEIKVEFQKLVEKGDPPTTRLVADWRERAEDLVWSLINSPEFILLP